MNNFLSHFMWGYTEDSKLLHLVKYDVPDHWYAACNNQDIAGKKAWGHEWLETDPDTPLCEICNE